MSDNANLIADLDKFFNGGSNTIYTAETTYKLLQRCRAALSLPAPQGAVEALRYRNIRPCVRMGPHGEWVIIPGDTHDNELSKAAFDNELDALSAAPAEGQKDMRPPGSPGDAWCINKCGRPSQMPDSEFCEVCAPPAAPSAAPAEGK